MKKYILSILILLCSIFCYAQTNKKPVIVITPIDLYGVDTSTGGMLLRKLQSEFTQTGKFTVVERNAFDKIFKNAKEFEDNSDWSSKEKVQKMQEALNANYIVTTTIESYEDSSRKSLYISIFIIDVNTTEIIGSTDSIARDVSQLMNETIKSMVSDIIKKIHFEVKEKVYKIGDIGPGGGIVFFVSKDGFTLNNDQNIYHYLEMSEKAFGPINWCPCDKCYAITETKTGSGKNNTENILIMHRNKNITVQNCAALLCNQYSTKNTQPGEWFLPSLDEIQLMYKNVALFVKADLSNPVFWTSSVVDEKVVYDFDFSSGKSKNNSNKAYVRPVRAF